MPKPSNKCIDYYSPGDLFVYKAPLRSSCCTVAEEYCKGIEYPEGKNKYLQCNKNDLAVLVHLNLAWVSHHGVYDASNTLTRACVFYLPKYNAAVAYSPHFMRVYILNYMKNINP